MGIDSGPIKAYYNDIDPTVCAWLQQLMDGGLIMAGTIDNRSIEHVKPEDLSGYTRVGFFAGIGGWDLALQLAGWPEDRPVWHGSCPCQPWSVAGEGRGEADDRHLWPEFHRLIRECRPPVVFGEQVASPAALRWLDGVSTDLEASGYAVGAGDLCAAGEGAPHIRQRLYWVAQSQCHPRGAWRPSDQPSEGFGASGAGPSAQSGRCGLSDGVGNSQGHDERRHPMPGAHREGESPGGSGSTDGMGQSHLPGRFQGLSTPSPTGFRGSPVPAGGNAWGDYRVVHCLDGKARRIGTGIQPLAHGVPARMVRSGDKCTSLTEENAGEARIMRLRGYGNALTIPVAVTFIKACESALQEIAKANVTHRDQVQNG